MGNTKDNLEVIGTVAIILLLLAIIALGLYVLDNHQDVIGYEHCKNAAIDSGAVGFIFVEGGEICYLSNDGNFFIRLDRANPPAFYIFNSEAS